MSSPFLRIDANRCWQCVSAALPAMSNALLSFAPVYQSRDSVLPVCPPAMLPQPSTERFFPRGQQWADLSNGDPLEEVELVEVSEFQAKAAAWQWAWFRFLSCLAVDFSPAPGPLPGEPWPVSDAFQAWMDRGFSHQQVARQSL